MQAKNKIDSRQLFYLRMTIVVLVGLAIGGCTQFGPRAIEVSRTDYNIVMNRTENEQMLLNLVRLRYGDRPYFLEVSALNTQFLIAPSGGFSGLFDFNGNNAYGLSGNFAYEEKPTVTYIPLHGQKFVSRVLARVSMETLLLLDSSGWKLDRVLNLCVEEMNDLDNAARASGPTPSSAPDVEPFRQAIALLSEIQELGGLTLFQEKSGDQIKYNVRFSSAAKRSEQFRQFVSLLGLDENLDRYSLTLNQLGDQSKAIDITSRSFMGVMYFLSHAVIVPADHMQTGRVRLTESENSEPFDWSTIVGQLMTIRSSDTKPDGAAVVVEYRGKWFYIDDSDIDSKSTFALLGQLYELQSDADPSKAPVLTLPVGG